jgi:hypothetical protein
MTTTTCIFCQANETAFAARTEFGVGSVEHVAALRAIDWEAARLGRQHSAGCATLAPMVTFG